MHSKSPLGLVAFILVIVGAINWGIVGLGGFAGSNWNIVNLLLGRWIQVEWIVYILVGLAGVYKLTLCSKGNCCCKEDAGTPAVQ